MKISLSAQTAPRIGVGLPTRRQEFVLGDSEDRQPISELTLPVHATVQETQLPQAEALQLFNRLNLKWDFSWTTTRTHSTRAGARRWQMLEGFSLARASGELKIEDEGETFTFASAVVRGVDVRRKGFTTRSHYEVVATDLTVTPGTPLVFTP